MNSNIDSLRERKKTIYLKLIFLSFLFIFILNFVSSVPPVTTVQQFPTGLIIQTSPQDYLIQNENYTLNFFVYNSSSGEELDNTTISCLFYMDNNKGELVINGNVTYNEDDYWDFLISGGNFSETGQYQFGIKCQDTNVGGTTVGAWKVTPSGKGGTDNIVFFLFIIIFLYGITFTGFFGKNIPITILGGMALLFLGIYLVNNGIIIYQDNITNYIAYLTIAVGAITSFWALLEQFEVI